MRGGAALLVVVLLFSAGCLTPELNVSTPDLVTPVCLSQKVAVGDGQRDRTVGNVEGKAERVWGFMLGLAAMETHTDNVQEEILKVTRGHHDQAVSGVELTVEQSGLWFFPLLIFMETKTVTVKGDVQLVE